MSGITKDRFLRYNEKIGHINNRIYLITEWIGDSELEDTITDIRTLLAVF